MRDLLLLAVGLLGAAVPDPEPTEDHLAPHTTALGVRLGEMTFEDAALLLGEAEIRRNGGEAHAGAFGVCDVGPDGTTLALVSHAEMGGGTLLTGLQLLAPGAEPDFSGDEGHVLLSVTRTSLFITTSGSSRSIGRTRSRSPSSVSAMSRYRLRRQRPTTRRSRPHRHRYGRARRRTAAARAAPSPERARYRP